jgi:hypothetical protein
MAALFPMMVNVHLVAYAVMMLIGLSGSDRAQGRHGCGEGENDLLHYEILESVMAVLLRQCGRVTVCAATTATSARGDCMRCVQAATLSKR